MLKRFKYLKPALVLILLFVGTKMLLVHSQYKVDTTLSLLVIVGLLASGVVASLIATRKQAGSVKAPVGAGKDGAREKV